MNREIQFSTGDTVLRYFRLGERIVTDPTGATVWHAHHIAKDKEVALWILPPQLFHLTRAHDRIAEALREQKPFANAGFVQATDFHFGGTEAAIELEPIGKRLAPLSDQKEGGITFDSLELKRLFEGISEPMEKLHHHGEPWGLLTPWQVMVGPGSDPVRLLPPRLFQIFLEESQRTCADDAADNSIAPFRSPQGPSTLAGDTFSVCAILQQLAGANAPLSASLQSEIENWSSDDCPKDIFALRSRFFSTNFQARSHEVPGKTGEPVETQTVSDSAKKSTRAPSVTENPVFLKIAAFCGVGLVILVLGFSLLTGSNGPRGDQRTGHDQVTSDPVLFSPEDFEWFDQPSLPAEDLAAAGGDEMEPIADSNAGAGLETDLQEESGFATLPVETPSEDPETIDSETGLPDTNPPSEQEKEIPSDVDALASAEGHSAEKVAPSTQKTVDDPDAEKLETTGSHAYSPQPEGGDIAALPADAAPPEPAAVQRPDPSAEPFAERIPPPTPPEALAHASDGSEVVAPARPEALDRDKIFGHTRVPITQKQWKKFESAPPQLPTVSSRKKQEKGTREKQSDPAFVRVKKDEARDYAAWLTETDRKAKVISTEQKYRLPRTQETENETIWREEDRSTRNDESRPFGLVLATENEKPVPQEKRKTREIPVRINPQGVPVKDLPKDESAIGRKGKADRPIWTRPGR